MSTWTKQKFKNFASLQRGFDLPQQNRIDGKYPVVASTSITAFHNQYKVKAPCVATGRSGALGEVLYINVDCWPLNTALWVKDFHGNNQKFVYYKLKTLGLEKFNAGAGVPTLNKNHLDTLEIKIPDIPTQTKIASVLSAYDDLIENNEKRIKALEEMAQTLYAEWFVKFKFPGHEKAKMVDSGTEYGKIPAGWELKSFYDVVDNLDSKRKPISSMKRQQMQGSYPYYGAAKIIDYIDDYIFDGKYLLIAEDGSVITLDGKPMLQFVNEKFWVSNHAHIVRGNLLSTEILYLRLRRFNIKPLITGSAQPKITKDNLSRVLFVVPENRIRETFSDIVSGYFDEIFGLQKQNQILSKTRDLLIPQLVTGRRELK